MATGPLSIAGMGLGGLALVAFKNPTLASPGTTSPTPLEIPPGVQGGSRIEQIDKTLEAIRDLQKTLGASKQAQEAAEVAQRARSLDGCVSSGPVARSADPGVAAPLDE